MMYQIIIFHSRAQALFPPSVNQDAMMMIFLEIKEKNELGILLKNKQVSLYLYTEDFRLVVYRSHRVSSMASNQMRQKRQRTNMNREKSSWFGALMIKGPSPTELASRTDHHRT